MINFKDPKDQTTSALAVLGMVLIGAAVIVSLFFNRGMDARTFQKKAKKDAESLEQRSLYAKSDNSVYMDAIDKYQWKESEDIVTPSALTIVSKKAMENQLSLVNFRPLKSVETNSMIQLPLQFTVDGSFAAVAAMLDSLENSDSRLAVQQVQFASQEAETDMVSANVNLLAYLAKPEKKKSIEPRPTNPAGSARTDINSSSAVTP